MYYRKTGYTSFLDRVYKESEFNVLDREQVLQKADILVMVPFLKIQI